MRANCAGVVCENARLAIVIVEAGLVRRRGERRKDILGCAPDLFGGFQVQNRCFVWSEIEYEFVLISLRNVSGLWFVILAWDSKGAARTLRGRD